ncbi:MAG: hypothetical protein IJJ86_06550 [Clostridia bacterium]|nr:hypothetical protein [Clostridia bacterium]
MWTGRIALLALGLLTGGGWFDRVLKKGTKRALLLLVPLVFGLTYVPTLYETSVRLCFAPCAFFLAAALLCPSDEPLSAAAAAALAGLLGEKLSDAFPLFPEQGLLTALPALALSFCFARSTGARALAIAAAPFCMLLFRAAGDAALFSFAVLELGSGDALAAETVGILLLLIFEAVFARLPARGRVTART